jgi:hypothetical protein
VATPLRVPWDPKDPSSGNYFECLTQETCDESKL